MKLWTISLITLILSSCATTNYSVGNAFSSDNVSKIVKNKTTSADLVNYFGQPFSKNVISGNEEKWIYMHSSGETSAQSYVFSVDIKSTGSQKTLDILLKNDTVINFAFSEGALPSYNIK